ncbi:GNAT family N-acetyltransferase [Actinoplanes sp. NPDC051411]|uniref:GNAT family N-acetyltransferase n=1 Tax=Actinoplanes sp. NPDC051411 TaxID=3155522 RepID=UPI00341FB713
MTLVVRPISGLGEIDLFNHLPYLLNDEVAADLTAGRRRTSWLWVALKGDRVVARAGWWARAGDEHPFLMDIFDVDGAPSDGLALLSAALPAMTAPGALAPPEFLRFVPAEGPFTGPWRTVLEQSGARLLVERRRLEWRPSSPVPPPSGRLEFRPADDPEELIGLMTLVLDGTLDAHSRTDLRRLSPREAAEEQYREELVRYPSPREWWRIAGLPSGEPVGFVIPARNDYNAVLAYIGVVPAHRGHGYIDDILAEGTRILADEGVPRIRANTDVGNFPMEAAFARAGYETFQRQIDMTWPRSMA